MNPDEPRPACAGKWDLFDSFDPEDQEAATHICATCPLLTQCRGWLTGAKLATPAGHPGPGGTWAGITMRHAPQNCGTEGGYTYHRRLKEPPCDDCKTAHAVGVRESYHRNRDASVARRARLELEDAAYNDATAREARRAYLAGDRSDWAVIGYRVYARQQKRARRAAKRQATQADAA